MLQRSSTLISLLIFTALPTIHAAQQVCYYPNGAIASDQVPCGPGPSTACCHRDAICLSNNLCIGIQQPFALGRGSCTDQTWESSNCPQHCQTAQPGSGCSIILLNSTAGINQYCCNSLVIRGGHDQPVCDVGSPFVVNDGIPIAGRGALAAMSDTASTTSTAATSPTPSSSLSPTSPTSTTPTPTPDPTPICSPPANSNSTSSTTDSQSQSQWRDAAIGVGVGVPLGVMATGLLLWALWERRGRKRNEQGPNDRRTEFDAMKHVGTDSGSWHTATPPPNLYQQQQRQSRRVEMYHGREPVELH